MTASMMVVPDLDGGVMEMLDDALLLCRGGRMRCLPARELLDIPPEMLIAWCCKRARYCLPTRELVDWLGERIAGKRAIEIAAGMGDLGYHLKIPQSDLAMQRTVFAEAFGSLVAPTAPPDDVHKLEATSAIGLWEPEIVIGAWVTERSTHPPIHNYGVREEEIIDRCMYIHIGNDGPHGKKRILQQTHAVHRFPWLVSRGFAREKDAIRIWSPT